MLVKCLFNGFALFLAFFAGICAIKNNPLTPYLVIVAIIMTVLAHK